MNIITLILIAIISTSSLGVAWGNESIKQDLKKLPTSTLIELNTELKKIKTAPPQGPINFMSNNRISEQKKETRINKINDLQLQTQAELKRRENLNSPDSIPIKHEFQSYGTEVEIEARAKAKAEEAERIIQRLLDQDNRP